MHIAKLRIREIFIEGAFSILNVMLFLAIYMLCEVDSFDAHRKS